jgi:ATP-dependent exoDNAse (exonuclease V) alpha subunit
VIAFTAPDKFLGVANHELAQHRGYTSRRAHLRPTRNNRRIDFNAGDHHHFDNGYAVTSHSSQGLTAERVLVHADTSVHPDLLNSRFAYVSISRASHQATLFTDDMAKLGPQLGADVSKTSALEINQGLSIP